MEAAAAVGACPRNSSARRASAFPALVSAIEDPTAETEATKRSAVATEVSSYEQMNNGLFISPINAPTKSVKLSISHTVNADNCDNLPTIINNRLRSVDNEDRN